MLIERFVDSVGNEEHVGTVEDKPDDEGTHHPSAKDSKAKKKYADPEEMFDEQMSRKLAVMLPSSDPFRGIFLVSPKILDQSPKFLNQKSKGGLHGCKFHDHSTFV